MIALDQFIDLLGSVGNPPNNEQELAIRHPLDEILQVVAGPGSGKTTVLLLRALRMVFVDGILRDNILITTFTRKAARDLRSRWLLLGEVILNAVAQHHDTSLIDLNRCRIGTLDSITQQVLGEFRIPGRTAPTVMARATSDLVLRRRAFGPIYRSNQGQIDGLLQRYTFSGNVPANQGQALATAKTLIERLAQDQVNLTTYRMQGPAENLIVDILNAYQERSIETNVYDFTFLEEAFLGRLISGTVSEWTDGIQAILIDEYQDTNPLQEAIYFAVINAANPTTTIVGDDDQSLYRFRGGSVELFTEFGPRCSQVTGRPVQRIDIFRNYRSTPEIVGFYNSHIAGDPGFMPARINPPKPAVQASRPSHGVEVLGMFRQDVLTLAHDLAAFLENLLANRHFVIPGTGATIDLPVGGDLGDVAFLAHTIRETRFFHPSQPVTELFPLHLRRAMEARGLSAFNPRGRPLRDIPPVQTLLGLLLVISDPSGEFTDELRITGESKFFLERWRIAAMDFMAANPLPRDNQGINGFVSEWQSAADGARKPSGWAEWPVLEIIYKLITWLPDFQNDPEHQVWMQALMETVDSASIESPYRMMLYSNVIGDPSSVHIRRSRESFIRDALVPIAQNNEDIDEDIFPSVPRDRMQFMTVHQAKGLEFPFVIVDVGSRFRSNHRAHRFRRFPTDPSNVVIQEDDIEPHLASPLRGHRPHIDRTFDDLVRLYYVAYSRPQSVLLLVGDEKCLKYGRGTAGGSIPNVALGWNRDGSWPWRQQFTGRKTPITVDPPFTVI